MVNLVMKTIGSVDLEFRQMYYIGIVEKDVNNLRSFRRVQNANTFIVCMSHSTVYSLSLKISDNVSTGSNLINL